MKTKIKKLTKPQYKEIVEKIYKGMFMNPNKEVMESVNEIITELIPESLETIKEEYKKKKEPYDEKEVLKIMIEGGLSTVFEQIMYQVAIDHFITEKHLTQTKKKK